jgi:hypothetical protein
MIRDVTGAASRLILAEAGDGISKPVAIAADHDGQRALVALDTSVAVLPLGGSPALLPCGCNASGLYRLRGSSIFRLNAPSANPLLLLDAGTAGPRIMFIASGDAQQRAPVDDHRRPLPGRIR